MHHLRLITTSFYKIGATELKVGEDFNIGGDDEKAMTTALNMCLGNQKDIFVLNI